MSQLHGRWTLPSFVSALAPECFPSSSLARRENLIRNESNFRGALKAGPLLFLLYINNPPENVNQSKARLFADDCLLLKKIGLMSILRCPTRNEEDVAQLEILSPSLVPVTTPMEL